MTCLYWYECKHTRDGLCGEEETICSTVARILETPQDLNLALVDMFSESLCKIVILCHISAFTESVLYALASCTCLMEVGGLLTV